MKIPRRISMESHEVSTKSLK